MARYTSVDALQHARKAQYMPDDDYFLVDSNLSSPSVVSFSSTPSASSTVTSNFSFLDATSRNAFRQAGLNSSDTGFSPLLCPSLAADEWSGTTNAVPDTPSSQAGLDASQMQTVLQHPLEHIPGGPLWQGHDNGDPHFNDYRHEKKSRVEQEPASRFEQEQRFQLTNQPVLQRQQLSAAAMLGIGHGYIGEENLRKIQAMQRQGSALEANQRLMNALYASRQATNVQGGLPGFQLSAEQRLRHLSSNQPAHHLDGNLLRTYGIQQAALGADPNQQHQSSLLQQGHNHQVAGQHVPFQQPTNHPAFQVQYQNSPNVQPTQQLYSHLQPRLQSQVLNSLKLQPMEGTKYPISVAAYTKCSQVLGLYIQEQRQMPNDNSVQFWRSLFRTFFAEKATQRWCLSCYNSTSVGRHAQGLFPMEHWRCNLCGVQPGRGFEASVDVLPRLFKIKYDSGLREELFFLELPDERYVLSSGHAVLEYSRAIHESSFPEIRIIKHGRLRVTFNSSFKICSWEFCTKYHEEVVPRRHLLQQVHQLTSLVSDVEREGFDTSVENLKSHCNAFNLAAKQLAVKLDAPSVNDLGFSKRYIRCLQIAEVVNSMEDLITFSKRTGLGPIESLSKFPNPRKRTLEDSSPQSSSITYLPSQSMYQAPPPAPKPDSSSIQKLTAPAMPFNQLPPEVQAHLSSAVQLQQQQHQQQQQQQQQQQHQQQHQHHQVYQSPLSRSDSVSQLRSKLAAGHFQPNVQTGGGGNAQVRPQLKVAAVAQNSAHSNHTGQQSLPGTPQSEMSDLRSNAS